MTDDYAVDAEFAHELQRESRTHNTRRLLWVGVSLAGGVGIGVLAAIWTNSGLDSALSGGPAGYLVGITTFASLLRFLQLALPSSSDLHAHTAADEFDTEPFVYRARVYESVQRASRRHGFDSVVVAAAFAVSALSWFAVAPTALSTVITVLMAALGVMMLFSAYESIRKGHDQWVGPNPEKFFNDTELDALIPPDGLA